jgi:hypothetical protein
MSENDQLTAKQALFVTAYLTPGLTIGAAAALVKIADSTARRYLKLPVVKQAIKDARADLYEQAMSALLHLIDKGVKALERNLEAGEEIPASVQVSAAKIVIDAATAMYKTGLLEQEVAELKRLMRYSEDIE